MPLEPGSRLGPYEITGDLGKGGMGEVYRARDTKLNRDVAIKVLPESVAADPDRLARFQREAEALAALNHQNIAHIYGLEGQAIVMELVEGPTLAERITGPMPVAEVLPIAKQIAEALEAAHERGIVHRDLKPANVKVREDGTVKVLDFGLAKALGPDPVTSRTDDVAMSPTLTARATEIGMVLGTAAYMAPEQAKGKSVDKRADVWAFGVVLFEMLAGRRPFEGSDVSQVMARVIDREPDWSVLPSGLPAGLRRLLRRALVKEKRDRLPDIAAARLEIADVEAGVADLDAAAATVPVVEPPLPTAWQRLRPWLAGTAAVALTALVMWALGRPEAAPGAVRRFAMDVPGDDFANTWNRVLAVSPDGRYVAMIVSGAREELYLRRIDEMDATPLRDTIESRTPFFSPDSQELGFWADDQIKRVAVTGGSPVVVGPSSGRPFGASWGEDGFIYVGLGPDGIARLPATGGQPEVVVEVETGQAHGPQLLPGGEWLLFTNTMVGGRDRWNQAQVVAQSLVTGDRVVLVEGGHEARVTPTGHLLYVLDNVLLAQAFDAGRMEMRGGPVAVLEGVRTSTAAVTGAAFYDLTTDGTLVYAPGSVSGDAVGLEWVDRGGQDVEPLPFAPQELVGTIGFALSPDRTRIVAEVSGDPAQLWLFDVDRAGGQRLTRDGGTWPVWSADGEWVYFAVETDDGADIWRKRADLSGEAEQVHAAPGAQRPRSVSTDGAYLFFDQEPDAAGDRGWGRLSLDDDRTMEMVVEGSGSEGAPWPSPDGRFVAYNSNESGETQLYAIELSTGRRWLLSTAAGEGYIATWTESDEIVFWSGADSMTSVAVTTEPEFTHAPPVILHRRPGQFFPYEVTSDGQRFVHTVRPDGADDTGTPAASSRVLVVQNWYEELKRFVPVR